MNYFWDNVKNKIISDIGREYGWIRVLSTISNIKERTISTQYRLDRLPRADDAVRIAQALGTTVEALVQPPRQSSRDKEKDDSPDSYNQTDNDPA